MLCKLFIPLAYPESAWFRMSHAIFIKVGSYEKRIIAAISMPGLFDHRFPNITESSDIIRDLIRWKTAVVDFTNTGQVPQEKRSLLNNLNWHNTKNDVIYKTDKHPRKAREMKWAHVERQNREDAL